ncbi:MAG: tetratricopeptide repeat protein [Candidatus Pacebacteria bacterium]|nr:tetratricopeptide repeat protein [Candidatus Paceibacterota bacterium]
MFNLSISGLKYRLAHMFGVRGLPDFPAVLKAAHRGNTIALYYGGIMFSTGRGGVMRDEVEASQWWKKSAELGNADAQNDLGLMYFNGRAVIDNPLQIASWCRKAASLGIADAQVYLGDLFDLGRGIKQDFERAAYWYRRAAHQGHAEGQMKLAALYHAGRGVKHNISKAEYWYKKASHKRPVTVPYRPIMGSHPPLSRNLEQSYFWWHKAAKRGQDNALFNLGICYSLGLGTAVNLAEAAVWFRKAATQGNAEAQINLAQLYCQGQGVNQDFPLAINWLSRAASTGHAKALFHLGTQFFSGEGVAENFVIAYAYFSLAFARGDEVAQQLRDKMRKLLTPQQIDQAQKITSNWKPGMPLPGL